MILTVHVKPRAKQEKVEWLDEDTAKVWVKEPPEKGRANEAVRQLLARELKIAPARLELIRGATTRIKQFSVEEK